MSNTIDLINHSFTVRHDVTNQIVGHFSNMDAAVRAARDFSFYQGVGEFPLQNRLPLHVTNKYFVFDQDYIDSRFSELSLLDSVV